MASASISCQATYNGATRVVTATLTSDYGNTSSTLTTRSQYTTSQGPYTRIRVVVNGSQVFDTGYCRDFNSFPCHKDKSRTDYPSVNSTGSTSFSIGLGAGHDNVTDASKSGTLVKATTPTLNTPSITNITRTGANASFSVSNNGGYSIVDNFIDCGTTNFGNVVGTITGTSGSFSGLTPNTTYYVRANSSNGHYRGYSSVKSFKTTGNAPTISSVSTTPSRTGCEFSITASYDTNDSFSSRTIEYGTSTSYGSSVTGTSLSNLAANTKYYYKVTINSSQGRSSSTTGDFTTTGNAPTISSVSTTPSRTGCSFNINGSYDTNASFKNRVIEYGTSTSYGSSTTENSISNLTPNTKYYYKVMVTDNWNRSSSWSTGDFTTTGNAPTISSISTTPARTSCSFAISDSYDTNASFKSRAIEYGLDTNYGLSVSTDTITGLQANTKYYYRAVVTDNWNRTSSWKTGNFTTTGNIPTINSGSVTNLKSKSCTISVVDRYDNNSSLSTMTIKIYLNNVLQNTITSNTNTKNTGDILKPGKNYVAKITVTDIWLRTSTEYTINFKTKGGFKFNGKMSDTIKINGKEVIGMKYNGIEII